MQIRSLILTAICASIAFAAAAPAFADDDWHRHEHREWREHAGQDHEWREHERRDDDWREHFYTPPVVVAPAYRYYAPPPVYYADPGYYR